MSIHVSRRGTRRSWLPIWILVAANIVGGLYLAAHGVV